MQGIVEDTSANHPLQYAVVMAIRLSDSVLVSYSRTDADGVFKIESLPVDTYQVIISHSLFGDQTIIVLGNTHDTLVDFKKIILPAKSITLKEVTVFGFSDAVYFNGDTLVYTADSFKVKKNAVVEDLLKKLPGIKVDDNGKIFSQGKAIDQLLVDGDEFFGSDQTVATKNLSAQGVESVQVYDKKNDNASESDSKETLKVMNLQMKDDAKKGHFGKVSAAGGLNDFYEGEFLLNKFKGKQKISLFALGSNTPLTSFSGSDSWKYGLSGDMSTYTNDDGISYSYFENNRQQGIPKTFKSGFYYTDMLGKRTKVSLNYTYKTTDTDLETTTASQYYLTDTTYKVNKTESSHKHFDNHIANITITQPLDSLTKLTLVSKLKAGNGTQRAIEKNYFLTTANDATRSTDIDNSSITTNYDVNNTLTLNRDFKNRDRKFLAIVSLIVSNNTSTGFLKSENIYFINSVTDSNTNQQKINAGHTQTGSATVAYTEPLSKKIKTEFSYDYSFTRTSLDKKTNDYVSGNYTSENSSLTSNYENTRLSNRGGIKFIYEVKNKNLELGTKLRQVESTISNFSSKEKISQRINNVLPFFTLRYKFSDSRSLEFRYGTNSNQPSLTQLQPVQDNTNPNYIIKGNPDLQPTFSHNFSVNYYSFKPITGSNLWTNLGVYTTNNAFSNSVSFDSIGRTVSQPANVNGNLNSYLYFGGELPLKGRTVTLHPSGNYSYGYSASYINGVKNISKESNPALEMEIEFRKDTMEFGFGGSYSYTNSSSSLSQLGDKTYTTYGYTAKFETELPWKFELKTNARYNLNAQRTQGYNVNTFIWNASLSKTFFKNENFILSVNANDILNQNLTVDRNIQDNVISDVKSTVIGRYILFKAVLKFNSTKTKEEKNDW